MISGYVQDLIFTFQYPVIKFALKGEKPAILALFQWCFIE